MLAFCDQRKADRTDVAAVFSKRTTLTDLCHQWLWLSSQCARCIIHIKHSVLHLNQILSWISTHKCIRIVTCFCLFWFFWVFFFKDNLWIIIFLKLKVSPNNWRIFKLCWLDWWCNMKMQFVWALLVMPAASQQQILQAHFFKPHLPKQ